MQPHKLNIQKEDILFLLVIVFAAVLYLFNLNYSDIWVDESFTKALVRHPVEQVLKYLAGDFHPPLYFLGLKLFTSVVGLNDFSIRLFSALGALGALTIGYTIGQRVFGKKGALCFCLLLLGLPMLTIYSRVARMYTWAAFVTTGVYLYSMLTLKNNRKRDLAFLGLFSLMAAYTHYYCLIAAFWADTFVLVYLFLTKNKLWRYCCLMGIVVFILFLPWFSVLISQTHAAQKDFWIPALSLSTLLSCYCEPFAQPYVAYNYATYAMIAIVYGLTIMAIYTAFVARKANNRPALGMALIIFNCTVLTAVIISITVRPLLYPRYIMTFVTMLIVPPTFFFMGGTYKWLKAMLLGAFLCCGIYVSIAGSYFSYGPYKQSLDYLQETHPDVKKIVHVMEITAGPFYEYDKSARWSQYCVKNEDALWYTNMEVFDNYHAINKIDDILEKGEVFCVANFPYAPLNKKIFDLILSQSETVAMDTVDDNKPHGGPKILLYILKYRGNIQ